MPHGYTNTVAGDGLVVVKRYVGPDRHHRRDTEVRALTALAGRLPVPRVLDVRGDTLTTAALPGVPGQDLITRGHAPAVLRSCGLLLPSLPLVHGDYGPQNMLFDPGTCEVTGIVDWEWAHDGDPIEDLAWAEWIVRTHHPDQVDALDALFEGYGHRPPFAARKAAALARCRQLRDRPGSPPVWIERVAATSAWTE
ncbi:MAG TPA: phosphotransferase [Actinoplanes sp.]|nr:phosphotransferase [Actinoplanes sp.]